MKFPSNPARPLLMAIVAAAVTGCQPSSPPVTQVAIKVNGDEISIHQVELAMQSKAATWPAVAASAAAHATLASLVDQELLAQAARQQGLDRDPMVIQRMEAAKRQVLAQAHQERIGARAVEPSSDEIDRYHDAHPELFAKRRLYQLQETVVRLPADRFATLQSQVNSTTSAEALREAVGREGLRSSVRHLSISPEDLPLGVLPRIAQLKPGESLTLPLEGGARVLTLIGSQPAPIGPDRSRKLIAQYLINERKRSLVGESIKSLRHEAKVEYVGSYASIAPQKNGPAVPENTQ
jgi:EpsD family peptidyl-prolyl cis-trans isomerase